MLADRGRPGVCCRSCQARAQDVLFERIHELNAAGSRVAAEATDSDFFDPERLERQRVQMRHYHEIAAKLHTIEVPDLPDLWYVEQHPDIGDWLRAHGRRASAETAQDLMARYGRRVPQTSKTLGRAAFS